jgi:hypothetical protein
MNNAKGGTGMNGHPIGTRVRIVRSPLAGRVGMMATVLAEPTSGFLQFVGRAVVQDVAIDGIGDIGGRGNPIAYPPDWLEPIRDDWDTDATPNAVASWAGGVWTPERVRVSAELQGVNHGS